MHILPGESIEDDPNVGEHHRRNQRHQREHRHGRLPPALNLPQLNPNNINKCHHQEPGPSHPPHSGRQYPRPQHLPVHAHRMCVMGRRWWWWWWGDWCCGCYGGVFLRPFLGFDE